MNQELTQAAKKIAMKRTLPSCPLGRKEALIRYPMNIAKIIGIVHHLYTGQTAIITLEISDLGIRTLPQEAKKARHCAYIVQSLSVNSDVVCDSAER